MSSPSDTDTAAAHGAGGAAGEKPKADGEKAGAAAATRAERKAERPSQRPGGPELLVGMTLSGRYLIERLIGEGGMGAVYQAEHTHMRKRLAVKVLHPEMSRLPEVVARFEREAMAAAHINHPNVASATDFGKLEDGSFFLVLEFVEGRSLRDVIAEGPMELGRALHVGRQIASALGRAHALGIVHRDLKPENVMLVTREGDADFVKVLDFGIAKVPIGELLGDASHSGPALTQLGMVYGTPEYMAPEQALGQEVDARADLYALGAILFEMVAGARPYEHESKVSLLGMHVTAPIPKMSERAPGANVPASVEALVTKLLAKEASARFSDSKELVDAIDDTVEALAASGRIAEPSQPLSRAQASSARSNGRLSSNANLALQPTSLAEPAIDARRARIESLVGRSRAALERALKGAPSWVTPVRVVITAGVAVALAIFVGVASLSQGGPVAGTAVAASSGSAAAPPRPPDPQTDDQVAAARAKIEKGDYATAIDALGPLEKSAPDRPDVHELLERAYTGVRNAKDAMREAALWLDADANAAADPKLEEDVRNAALFKDSQDDAFNLLESQMGPRGVDILYDIAYGASGRQYPQAAARAKHSLESDQVQGRASPALAVLLDFRDAKTCDAKRALLDRVREHGDARLLVILQPYTAPRGCGFLGQRDCYPCMHKDTALRDAISAVEERAAH